MPLRTYTLHIARGALRGDGRALDASAIVPDGFSWPAFAFSVLWFLRHRAWLAAGLVALLLAGLVVLGRLLGLSSAAGVAVTLLALALIGLEASSLRRWTLARQGRAARDAVIAGSQDEAEAKIVARWLAPASSGTVSPRAREDRAEQEVIGLFPLSEGGR